VSRVLTAPLKRTVPQLSCINPKLASHSTLCRGFSLAEIIVVLIILGALSAMVAPRLLSASGRQAEVEAQAVRAKLSAFARKEQTSNQQVSLLIDDTTISLEAVEEQVQGAQTDPTKASGSMWKPAKGSRPVKLSFTEFSQVLINNRPSDLSKPVRILLADTSVGGGAFAARPTISILLSTRAGSSGNARAWQIDLPAAVPLATARAIVPGSNLAPIQSDTEDLDASGRRADPW
jgi:prepilin-type N-terminal cleavage/methylation domain-containing protein